MPINQREPALVVEGILRRPTVLFCGSLVLAVACASVPPAPDREAPADPPSVEGVVSYEQVIDPDAARPVADVRREYVRPTLHPHMPLPGYPDEALAAGAPSTEVVVRVEVGADGTVTSVRPSPLAEPPANDWYPVFFESVRATVTEWQYEPCHRQDLEDGPDRDGDGKADYRILAGSTPIAIYLDLVFRFQIVDGAGEVAMDPDGGG